MEIDLTKFNYIINKQMDENWFAKEVKAFKINGEIIIIKTFFDEEPERTRYFHEKNIYIMLKDEDFLPKLKYFDNKNLKLGFTNVGDTIRIYKYKNKEQYNKLCEKFNKEIININDILFDKYGIYHNDLREKNICIDSQNKIRLIDFEFAGEKLRKGEKKYFVFHKI
ncbi:hypothetical protein OAI84_00630 [bacterium]|nr:hypothetical protein [bacterium]